MDSDTIYLVDGSGYIFRAYYAVRPLSTKAGLPTNALFGFTKMLEKLLRDLGAKYVVVAFDTGVPTFRHDLYAEYKANREECPEDLAPQMPYFRRIVKAMGIPCLERDGYEADDIIATLAVKAEGAGYLVKIVSGDKDLTQLVDDSVQVWDAMRDILYDAGKVREKFGVDPAQMQDYLAITGDSSDNIPGVKGVGPKGAQRLLEHFGSIERLVENPEEIEALKGLRGAKSIRAKIESAGKTLRLSKNLVKLDTEVEPFLSMSVPDELQWRGVEHAQLAELFHELEFTTMLESIESAAGKASNGAEMRAAEKDYRTVAQDGFDAFLEELTAAPEFAFDTETTSLDIKEAELLGISFCWEEGRAYYLPLASCVERDRCVDKEEAITRLAPIFGNPAQKKIGLHLKFDIEVLAEAGLPAEGVGFDAMLASYVLRPDVREHGLKALARKHLGELMTPYLEVVGDEEHLGYVPLDRVSHYACHDAECSWLLYKKLQPMLGERAENDGPSQRRVFEDIELPLVPVLVDMERTGIKVDGPYLAGLGEEFSAEAERCRTEICELAGEEFNLNSPKQLSEILYEKLCIPTKGIKRTKTGHSTDAGVLNRLALEYVIAEKLLVYRELHKLNSTYIEALQRLINPRTGRIHASFNQAVAATGRLSSSEPNLQNIPIRNPRGRRIRSAFIAEQGAVLISADYSQIELRVLAHLSGDEALQSAFENDEDIHERTAREIFGGLPASEHERKDLRRIAKTINFGIIYGMSAFRLAGDLGVSRKQAQEYIDEYFARYPKVRGYFDSLKEQAKRLGYVETLFGRRRYVEDLDTEGRDAGYASRSMMNAPIQGTAAEIIKAAMSRLHARFSHEYSSAHIVLQVHDELVCEAPAEYGEPVKGAVVGEMESAVDLRVPLKVDVRIGQTWGDAR